jgi:hypothetical protein
MTPALNMSPVLSLSKWRAERAEGGRLKKEAVFNCVDVVKMIAAFRAERDEGLGGNPNGY